MQSHRYEGLYENHTICPRDVTSPAPCGSNMAIPIVPVATGRAKGKGAARFVYQCSSVLPVAVAAIGCFFQGMVLWLLPGNESRSGTFSGA